MDKTGVIYILTNPSFPDMLKLDMQTISTSGYCNSTGASVFPLPSGSTQPMRSIRGFLI